MLSECISYECAVLISSMMKALNLIYKNIHLNSRYKNNLSKNVYATHPCLYKVHANVCSGTK